MVSRGGWEKYQRVIVRRIGIIGIGKTESFNSRGGGLAFKLLFPFLFLAIQTTTLRTLVYAVKVI